MYYVDGEECNHEYSFDIGIEEHRGFPSEDFKYSGLTQSKDASPHPMGCAFLDTSNDVSPQIEPSSNSKRNHGVVKYFLPIRSIDELRGLIKVNEAENVRDEQTILGCVEPIDQRKNKILEYQERIIDIQKQIDNYKCL